MARPEPESRIIREAIKTAHMLGAALEVTTQNGTFIKLPLTSDSLEQSMQSLNGNINELEALKAKARKIA